MFSIIADAELNSLEGYCSAEPVVPELVSTSNDQDIPVRWKAPECLKDNRYSTASDVWAFGVLMYEVLTYGCTPYWHWDDDHVPSHVSYEVHFESLVLIYKVNTGTLVLQFGAPEPL